MNPFGNHSSNFTPVPYYRNMWKRFPGCDSTAAASSHFRARPALTQSNKKTWAAIMKLNRDSVTK